MAEKNRVVLVGCGSIAGACWLPQALKIKGLEIAGLVDIDRNAARKRKEEFDLRQVDTGDDLRGMLRAVNPDIVFDCTVPEAHVSVTLEGLRHGCHVLGEKPLADSMENARRMVRAAQRANRIYAVTQNHRYLPRIRAFRKYVGSDSIGRLTALHCDFFLGPHFGGFRDKMKHVLLLDMAIHTFDAIRFISGADPAAVYCAEWNPSGSWYKHGACAAAIFEMSNGIIATYRGSWCCEGLNTSWESQWRAVGEKGSAIWDGAAGFKAQVATKTDGFLSWHKDVTIRLPASDGNAPTPHGAIIREFLRCVRTGKEPQTVCTDNIKSLSMVFGAIESAEKTARVRIGGRT